MTYKAIMLFKALLEAKQKHIKAATNMGNTTSYIARLSTNLNDRHTVPERVDKRDFRNGLRVLCGDSGLPRPLCIEQFCLVVGMRLHVRNAWGQIPNDLLGCLARQQ